MKLFGVVPSLRRKIGVAYIAIALIALALSAFAVGELRLLEEKILLGERVAEFFDTALEIRRFERNYFLHGQAADLVENAHQCEQMVALLDRQSTGVGTLQAQVTLRDELSAYRRLIDAYAGAASNDQEALEPQVRAAGQRLVAGAETIVEAERQYVRSSLASFRAILIGAVIAVALLTIAVGQALARRVVRPLQTLERSVNTLGNGGQAALAKPSDDREIVAIVNAFNALLHDLELRQKHLLRSEKLAAMGTMVSGVAHELNNPISNIWSSCQILLEDPMVPESERGMLRQIDEQSIRARNIVRSLLDFARDRPFAGETIALRDLVQQTLRFLKSNLPPTLVVDIDIAEELRVHADRQRLQQALLNLIANAIQASDPNGRISIAAAHHAVEAVQPADPALLPCHGMPYVEIVVVDAGHGIPADVLPRIFDPFFTTKDIGKGMGLGLYIVYRIVDEHGGCISLTSRPGEGTRVVIRLPLRMALGH